MEHWLQLRAQPLVDTGHTWLDGQSFSLFVVAAKWFETATLRKDALEMHLSFLAQRQ